MKNVYHILSSDIPHHNRQLLHFFQHDVLPLLPNQSHRFYVVGAQTLQSQFPRLSLHPYPSKRAIARAVIDLAKTDGQAHFVLHGQFNLFLWFAIFFGKLPACRCTWHVWGADLYQDSTDWRFRLFYPVRRRIQRKFPRIWATQGDLCYVRQQLQRKITDDRVVYFPTKMAPLSLSTDGQKRSHTSLTVLLGNSGDCSNRHLIALQQINQRLGNDVNILIPMGYPSGNHAYIAEVGQCARLLYAAHQIDILTERIDFDRYISLLQRCDLGYFNFERQQGIGTLCLCIQLNIPVVLHRNNPFTEDMQAEGVPFVWQDELSRERIVQTRRDLQTLDKTQIAFFAPNYLTPWLDALTDLADG